MTPVTTAVVLAAGRGTRMQADRPGVPPLSAEQEAAARQGAKAMMPVGRPFLDYVLSSLADAGMRRIGLVVAPDHAAIADRYRNQVPPRRFELGLLVQPEPAGTANALLAAEEFVGWEAFLMVNGDNLYPAEALAALARTAAPALIGWDPEALVSLGNVEAARLAAFALVQADPDDTLAAIVEKPSPAARSALGAAALVSMNSWCFDPAIFSACRAVQPSVRGELELQDAVAWAMAHLGMVFRVIRWAGPVLDLSGRADVAAVTDRLRARPVDL